MKAHGEMLQVASGDDNAALAAKLVQARQRLLNVYADLPERFWTCPDFPYLVTINPPLWELAHVAWFQEYWCRRHDYAKHTPVRPPRLAGADAWLDSRVVPHAVRWHPGHPARADVAAYLEATLEDTLEALSSLPGTRQYPFRLALYHETMHVEALLMTLRTLGLPLPAGEACVGSDDGPSTHAGQARPSSDRAIPAGRFKMGSAQDELHFVFDNERGAHERELEAFRIAALPVTRGEFLDFLRAAGEVIRFASPEGRAWLEAHRSERAAFAASLEGAPDDPVEGVCAYEAEAYCQWAGRRLPTEFEWEAASRLGVLEGNGRVWEWTASAFEPYEGFTADPYREYSQPWFGDHRVLRGGSWATHPDLKRPAFRNFYLPGRCDVFAGFRTCAV